MTTTMTFNEEYTLQFQKYEEIDARFTAMIQGTTDGSPTQFKQLFNDMNKEIAALYKCADKHGIGVEQDHRLDWLGVSEYEFWDMHQEYVERYYARLFTGEVRVEDMTDFDLPTAVRCLGNVIRDIEGELQWAQNTVAGEAFDGLIGKEMTTSDVKALGAVGVNVFATYLEKVLDDIGNELNEMECELEYTISNDIEEGSIDLTTLSAQEALRFAPVIEAALSTAAFNLDMWLRQETRNIDKLVKIVKKQKEQEQEFMGLPSLTKPSYEEVYRSTKGNTISRSPATKGLLSAVTAGTALFENMGPEGDAAIKELKDVASPITGIPVPAMGIRLEQDVIEFIDKRRSDSDGKGTRFFASATFADTFAETESVYACTIVTGCMWYTSGNHVLTEFMMAVP